MKILACLLFMCTIPPLIWCRKPDTDRTGPRVCVMGNDYCDPTWLPATNLNRALTGIDLAKKPLMPYRPEEDPSVKQIIFNAVTRNDKLGNMEALNFIHLTDKLVCDAQFNVTSWYTMDQYLRGSTATSMSSWGLSYEGPTVSAEVAVPGDVLSLEASMPPNTAGFESGNSEGMAEMEKFFSGGKGSISHGEATCSLYKAEININDPSLSLNPSFVSALKNIDLAKTAQQKTYAMKKFIDNFGSHYAKKTMMGIGAAFETRFNGEETQNSDEQQRNECSKKTGGFRVFGIGSESKNNKCSSSLDVSNGLLENKMKRFKSITYGTPLAGNKQSLVEWGDLVREMMIEGELSPVPIQQDLAHIMDLFATPAVADIVHDDGSKINVENLFKTALDGYRHYCAYAHCKVPGCAKTVLMKYGDGNAGVFNQQEDKPDYNSRPTYINTDQGGTSYLKFNENGNWFTTRGYNQIEMLKTSACPQKGFMFQSISYTFYFNGPLPVPTWKKCAMKCFGDSECNYWQYDNSRKLCSLIRDYGSVTPTAGDVLTGTRDCPGDKSLFAYGLCLENMSSHSMWVEHGNVSFKKGVVVEAYDPTLLVIAGGMVGDDDYYGDHSCTRDCKIINNVDVFFKKQCRIKALPYKRNKGNLIVTAGQGKLLYCGGEDKDPAWEWRVTKSADCWNSCKSKGAFCPTFCGKDGYCCRTGYGGCPNGASQATSYEMHKCVKRTDKHYTTPIPGCLWKYNTEDYSGVSSMEDCQRKCDEKSWCRSLDYISDKKICYLSKETKSSKPSYWYPRCYNTWRPSKFLSSKYSEKTVVKGNPISAQCLVWDPKRHDWSGFDDLPTPRSSASSVTMPNGVYILGGRTNGMESTKTSDFLPIGKDSKWKAGPTLPHEFRDGCAVKISETKFVIIGGFDPKTSMSLKKVSTYDTVTEVWEHKVDLKEARNGHACAFHPPTNTIIVSGGRASPMWESEPHVVSTEVIPVRTWVPRNGGNIGTHSDFTMGWRDSFAMVTVGGKYPTVYALGSDDYHIRNYYFGPNSDFSTDQIDQTKKMEEWDPENEVWKPAPFKLNISKIGFSALAVPPVVACH